MVATITAAVAAAATAGVSAYSAADASAKQAKAQERASTMQAEAEAQAGAAQRRLVEYNTKRAQASLLSREASAGVVVSEGSLLENEMAFASDASYRAQMAAYPHTISAEADTYGSQLARYSAGRYAATAGPGAALAVGSSLASSYVASAGRPSPAPAAGDV
jgi:hypothetical protein